MRILDEDPEHKYDHKNIVPTEKEKNQIGYKRDQKGFLCKYLSVK